jgi:hypothetical protein
MAAVEMGTDALKIEFPSTSDEILERDRLPQNVYGLDSDPA